MKKDFVYIFYVYNDDSPKRLSNKEESNFNEIEIILNELKELNQYSSIFDALVLAIQGDPINIEIKVSDFGSSSNENLNVISN